MNILRNKQGASLVLVIATMFFLLALGTSAFTAAGLNMGAGYVQRDRNQLELYSSSMERTIISQFEQTWTETETSITAQRNTLGGRIMLEAYETGKVNVTLQPITIDSLTFEPVTPTNPAGPGGMVEYRISITSSVLALGGDAGETFVINKQPHVRCEREFVFNGATGAFDIARVDPVCQPLVATINGELRVILTTVYTTPGGARHSMETVTTLRVHNIRIEEKWFNGTDGISGAVVPPNCRPANINDPGSGFDATTFLANNRHRTALYNPNDPSNRHLSPPYNPNPIFNERMIITDIPGTAGETIDGGAIWEVIRHEKNAA